MRIKSAHNAAIKALRTGDSKPSDRIHSRNSAIIAELFKRTQAGIIAGFYLEDEKTFRAYHRSPKEAGKIQLSIGYFKNGDLIPLSDAQFVTAAEAERYGVTSGNYKIIGR